MSEAIMCTPDDVAAEIYFQAAAGLVCLVVEGESDALVLSDHIVESSVVLIVAGNKEKALEIDTLASDDASINGSSGSYLVLVDRDDDVTAGLDGHVLRTYARDLDAEIVASPEVFRKVAKGLYLDKTSPDIQRRESKILNAVGKLQSLRSTGCQIGIPPDVRGVGGRYRAEIVTIPLEDICLMAWRGSGIGSQVVDLYRAEVEKGWVFSDFRGHDIHLVMTWFADKVRQVSESNVQERFRLALSTEAFTALPTVRELETWAKAHGLSLWGSSEFEQVA